MLAGIAAGSFGFAVHRAAVAPEQAYFSAPARAWELALGGLLAMVPRSTGGMEGAVSAAAAAWAGAAAIAAATLVLDEGLADAGRFPRSCRCSDAVALLAAGTCARPGRPDAHAR